MIKYNKLQKRFGFSSKPLGHLQESYISIPDIALTAMYCWIGAGDRNRTGTVISNRRILSPLRLPVPPPRHDEKNMEAAPRIELGMKVLQTSALPLGYAAIDMERKTRLELATPTLARWCSTTELLPHHCGAQGRNWTADTGIFSPLLYRLSYLSKYGDLDRIWTDDLRRDRATC